MKSRTHIVIGLIPAVAIIAVDVLYFCFAEQYGGEVVALAFTTVICVSFGSALLTHKPKAAWRIYYTWWTFQLVPLIIALVCSVYLISNKSVDESASVMLCCALYIGLPSFFFRVGLKGVDHYEASEKPEKEHVA